MVLAHNFVGIVRVDGYPSAVSLWRFEPGLLAPEADGAAVLAAANKHSIGVLPLCDVGHLRDGQADIAGNERAWGPARGRLEEAAICAHPDDRSIVRPILVGGKSQGMSIGMDAPPNPGGIQRHPAGIGLAGRIDIDIVGAVKREGVAAWFAGEGAFIEREAIVSVICQIAAQVDRVGVGRVHRQNVVIAALARAK